MVNINKWHQETIAQKTVQALQNNGFHSIYVQSKEEAANFIMYHVNTGSRVGIGGSISIKNLNVEHNIIEKGGTILNHSLGRTQDEKLEIMRSELTSDLYLCSSNAVTLDGHLVNIDGSGNRIAAMTFGPKKVIVVVGINKIVKDDAAAYERIRYIASPMNNKRLNYNNPCVASGICSECNSKERICRIYSTIKYKPLRSDISIIIVGEQLGY